MCCFDLDPRQRPLKLISISHGWLTPYPDPSASSSSSSPMSWRGAELLPRLQRGGWFLLSSRAARASGSLVYAVAGRSSASSATTGPPPSLLASLWPSTISLTPTGPGDTRAHGRGRPPRLGVGTMGTWYAHDKATTVALDVFPAGWGSTTPYEDRGWTTIESAVSALVKSRSKPVGEIRARERAKAVGVGSVRPPPLHPEAFAAKLARKVFTNGKSDLELVAGIYAHARRRVWRSVEAGVCGLGWGDEEVGVGKGAAAREERDVSQSQQQRQDRGRRVARACRGDRGGRGAAAEQSSGVRHQNSVADLDGGALKGVRGAWD